MAFLMFLRCYLNRYFVDTAQLLVWWVVEDCGLGKHFLCDSLGDPRAAMSRVMKRLLDLFHILFYLGFSFGVNFWFRMMSFLAN
jgi:hypothetical protein